MDNDLPFDHPLREGMPSCDPSLVVAYVPIPEDTGAQCIESLLEKLPDGVIETVTATRLSPVVLLLTYKTEWVSGSLMLVAGRRAVRVMRQGWSLATPDAIAESVRVMATQVGVGVGVMVSVVLTVLLLSIVSEGGAPAGELHLKTLISPFLIPVLFGAAIGTVIGARIGRSRAERARVSGKLERDAKVRDAFLAAVVATLKGSAP